MVYCTRTYVGSYIFSVYTWSNYLIHVTLYGSSRIDAAELVTVSYFLTIHNHPLVQAFNGEVSKGNVTDQCTVEMPWGSQFPPFCRLGNGWAFLFNVTRFSFVFKNISKKCL